MEPTTLIVSALSAAAGLIAKSALSEAAKDAYKKLRERLFKKHADQADIEIAVKAVETQPDSPARQALLAEELTKTQAAHDETLLHLAQTLIEAINQAGANVAAGRGTLGFGGGGVG